MDWDTFHTVFAEAFGFPDFYGRNMDAWTDCMSSLDTPADSMTAVHVAPSGTVSLQINNAHAFIRQCPQQCKELIECTAAVNERKAAQGTPPLLALSFNKAAHVFAG